MLVLLSWFALSTAPPGTVQLQLERSETWNPRRLEVHIEAEAPLVTLGEGVFAGLLQSTPALAWQCMFDDEIRFNCFSDDAGNLPPASRIELRIAPGVLVAQDGRPVGGLVDVLTTRLAHLDTITQDLDTRGLPQLILVSQQPLVADSLTNRMVVRQGGQEWAVQLQAMDAATLARTAAESDEPWLWRPVRQAWTFQWPASLQPGQRVQLIARPGIAIQGGELPTSEEQRVHDWLPSARLQLQIACGDFFSPCHADSVLELRANTRPDARTLAELATALPSGMHITEPQPTLREENTDHDEEDDSIRYQLVWPLRVDRAGQRYRMRIPAHWRGGLGQPVADEFVDYTSGPLRPQLNIQPDVLLLPLAAPAPEQTLRWANRDGFELLLRGLGETLDRPLQRQLLRPATPLQTRSQVLPGAPRDLQRAGGTQWGVLRTTAAPESDMPDVAELPLDQADFGRAWADLGLHALVFEDQIQLVSTDLYSAAPLARVRMQLLQQDLQAGSRRQFRSALAVGNTTAQGQLRLHNTEAEAIRTTVIRARRGNRSTVLPLQALTLLARNTSGSRRADTQRFFSWSDRIAYRPGDTVQLRLLVRMPQPRALAPPAPGQRQWRLHFKAEWPELALGELPITLDDFGGASVQWQVPAGARDGRVKIELESSDRRVESAADAAFLIASVDPAALDVRLQLQDGGVTPDQLPQLELGADYFSGGAAVGVHSRIEGLLDAGDAGLGERFGGYRFQSDPAAADDARDRTRLETQAGCLGGVGDVSVGISQSLGDTDARGRSRGVFQLPAFHCALGELKLTPVARVPGQADSYGLTQRRVFSREPVLLGLQLPHWARTGQAIEVGAVAVRVADLTARAETALHIVIERKDGAHWAQQQRCEIGGSSAHRTCRWLPQQAGTWRLLLSADGASSVKQVVTVWGDTPQEASAELEGPAERLAAGSTATYSLRQPYPAARVLLTVESDGLLHQQWHVIDAAQARLPLLIDPSWAPCFHVAVLVVPQTTPGQPLQPTLANQVRSCVEVPKPTLIELAVEPLQCSPAPPDCKPVARSATDAAPAARPGDWVRVRVQSRHPQRLRLSLTAIDAAMLDLDPELRTQRDPHATAFLQREGAGAAGETYSLLAWAKTPDPAGRNLRPEPPQFDGGAFRHRGTRTFDDSEEMASVEVVGSRIAARDVFIEGQPRHGRLGERDSSSGLPSPHMRRIPRQHFADTAFWLPDEPLEPGASRVFDLQLPDNLTRWQIEALAVDAADQFQLASTQIEAGLPLEARALAPARVFVGDHSVLGAQLRNSGQADRHVAASLDLLGSTDRVGLARSLALAAASSTTLQLPWHARDAGEVSLLAQLDAADDSSGDAVLKSIQVQSRFAPWIQRQSGLLLQQSPSVLELSRVLPPGAPAQLRVQLSRNPLFGLAGLFDQMRDYPHRCLEQRLSRALVANHARALATLAGTDVGWATQAVIDEPLANLPRYRTDQDGLVFFNPDYERADPQLQVYALLVLAELGQQLPDDVHEAAVDAAGELVQVLAPKPPAKQRIAATPITAADADAAAFALRALAGLQRATPAQVRLVLDQSGQLSPWGNSQLLHALAGSDAFAGEREQLVKRVRGLGERTGARIRLRPPEAAQPQPHWLASDIRDSCAVLGALLATDQNSDAHAEHAGWLYGLFDAYGSGLRDWDTQTLATCSSSAAAYARRWLLDAPTVAVQVQADARTLVDTQLELQQSVQQDVQLGALQRPRLQLQASGGQDVAYAISLSQQRDRMSLPAAAQGLALERHAEVWRGGEWLAVPQAVVRVGDWLRVRLVLNTPHAVAMVALSDDVPGGLRAINKALEGVSDAQVQQADEGSFWFFERQLGSTDARFYATSLPPGRHEILYYTQARHAGHYAWPGATAELMYNLQRNGRSAAAVLEIQAADSDRTMP